MGQASRLREGLSAELGQGFVWSPVVLGLGILLFFQVRFEPSFAVLGWVGCCAVLSGAALRHVNDALRPVLWAIALMAAGFALAGLRSATVAAPILEWRYYGPIEGRVVGLDRSASGALRVTLDQVTLGRRSSNETPQFVRLSLFGSEGDPPPQAGARVMTTAHLSPPSGPAEPHGFDFQRHAWFGGLGGLGYSRVPVLLAAYPPPKA